MLVRVETVVYFAEAYCSVGG